jgi:AcrR family transcriptional regulator
MTPYSPGPRDARGVLAARILAAARAEFAENGAAGTTIRSVARVANVDPALIYHYFGSKSGLLEASTTPPLPWINEVGRAWAAAPRDQLGIELMQTLIDSWADDEIALTLRAALLTAAHDPSARIRMRTIVEEQLLGLGTGHAREDLRRGLIASQILGLALMRYVWKLEPIASLSTDHITVAVAPNLQYYIDLTLTPSNPEETP